MPRSKRRIRRADISFISLCERGANQLTTIYKAEDGSDDAGISFETLLVECEKFDERGELTAIVYAPELRDSQGDIASADVIKDMAYRAMQKGLELDLIHNEKPIPRDQAYIAETFIVQKGDPRFQEVKTYDGRTVDVAGAWAVTVKLEAEGLRKQYREGKFNGVSMGGQAVIDQEPDTTIADAVKALALRKRSTKGDPEMDEETLSRLLKANNAALAQSVTAALGEALKDLKPAPTKKTEETPKDEAPVFADNPDDRKAVRKHLEALKKYEARQEIDWNDPEAVEEYLGKLQPKSKETPPTHQGDQAALAKAAKEEDEACLAILGKKED